MTKSKKIPSLSFSFPLLYPLRGYKGLYGALYGALLGRGLRGFRDGLILKGLIYTPIPPFLVLSLGYSKFVFSAKFDKSSIDQLLLYGELVYE